MNMIIKIYIKVFIGWFSKFSVVLNLNFLGLMFFVSCIFMIINDMEVLEIKCFFFKEIVFGKRLSWLNWLVVILVCVCLKYVC